MSGNELKKRYFRWLCQLVQNGKFTGFRSYQELLGCLAEQEFTWTVEMDENRARDGIELRYRFGCEMGYDYRYVESFLDGAPCTVLEMMAALALRVEEHLMTDPQYGDRTGQWFWEMVVNLGLADMTDECFDRRKAEKTIRRFLHRHYSADGHGGLFWIPGCPLDLRKIEIWYQLCHYLSGRYEG